MGRPPTESEGRPEERLLDVRGVSYTYPGGTHTLERLSVTVRPGEIVGIVGPSGCGKSTLLALAAGLAEPTEGTIEWSAAPSSKTERLFTLIFQRDTLLPWLSVERNIEFGLRLMDMSSDERAARLDRLLTLGGLTAFRDALPFELSGGMRRRVAFLTGVAPLPRILLLDEPFSALDEPTRVVIHGEILKILAEFGMAAVLVTHDLSEAITLSSRVYILSRRPASVAAEYPIPFGYPRKTLEIRETEEYLRIYRNLWHDLSEQIELSQQVGHVG